MTDNHWLDLADAIERRLLDGRRHYTLRGAQLDWVIEALHRARDAVREEDMRAFARDVRTLQEQD
jgi:hypothetical protein